MNRSRVAAPRRYSRHVGPTFKEQMQRIVQRYRDAGNPWPATTHQMADWAIRKGLWAPQPVSLIEICADQLARAMREEYIVDAQGRTVRAKHCARISQGGEQLTLWFDIRTARREDMAIAFQQRRHQVLGDCRQLKNDVTSFNENRCPDNPIQVILDFEFDLQEEALARQA